MPARPLARLLTAALTATLVAVPTAAVAAEPADAPSVPTTFDDVTFEVPETRSADPSDGEPAVTAATDDATSTRRAVGSIACPTPPGNRQAPNFRDVPDRSPHATTIDCVVRWGIAQGTSDRTYAPRRDVTRAQMATFVANLVRATGRTLPTGTDRFRDDAGSPHEANINALANAGIVTGTGSRTYGPNRDVTRGQAATILANTHRFLRGTDLPAGTDRFRDDTGSPHETNINRLANAGVINGLTDTRFGHGDPLKRDQMASLLARFLTPALGGANLGSGTIWYSEYGELRRIDATNPRERRLVYEFGVTDSFTVNTARGEFVHVDDDYDVSSGEYRNQVFVRSTRDNALAAQFRWFSQCGNPNPGRVMTDPLASPDGQWFIANADNGFPYNAEIRDRTGACVAAFGPGQLLDWTWFADGDLLAVIDSSRVDDAPGDHALVRIPRSVIATGSGSIQVLEVFTGPLYPDQGIAISKSQRQIAYSYDADLHVVSYTPGELVGTRHRVARGTSELIWPEFSPDDRSIILRHRTGRGGVTVPSSGQVHLVANHRVPATEIRTDGPTQLAIPDRAGQEPRAFDAKWRFFWGR